MTIDIALTDEQKQPILDSNRQQAFAVVNAADFDALSDSQFVFFAAFDGTNNDLFNKPQKTNVAQLETQVADAHGADVLARYYAGPGTRRTLTFSSWLPLQVTRQVISQAQKAYTEFARERLICAGMTVVMAHLISACATGPEIVDHTFEFNALRDSPGVQVLDFRYGTTNFPGARNPEYLIREGKSFQRTAITGPMKRPDSLYVKWRTLSDNKIHENTVDLRNRLPRDFTGDKVYFLLKGPQLYVYLVSRKPRPAAMAPNGPSKYHDKAVVTIYPD